MNENDLEILRQAKANLEHPGFAMRVANLAGKPFDKLLRYLPAGAHELVTRATEAAVKQCLEAALRTVDAKLGPGQPRNGLHKFAVAMTGAAGGAFGLTLLAIELPVTTTLMFRSICDIARSEGEDLDDPDTRLQCLSVLALGGTASSDDEAETGYFALRAALGQAIAQAVAELAGRNTGVHASSMLLRLVNTIGQRFSIQVSQQVAAKSIPAIGAVLGATINALFIDHFQRTAQAHFAVRRLERRYGAAEIERRYAAL